MSDEKSMPWALPSTFVSEESVYNGLSRCLPELKDRTYFAMHHMLESFVKSNWETMSLPPGLSSLQKNYILTIIQCLGLKVEIKSENGMNIVECVKTNAALRFVRQVIMGEDTVRNLRSLLYWCENELSLSGVTRIDQPMPFIYRAGVLTYGNPRVPKPAKSDEFKDHRSKLPIFKYREEILRTIQENTFLLIKGSAGCGKTTQIPQYLLEEAELKKKPVRILVCLPRRVAAISVCDRVAAERGEKVGHTVGYQIRLESCTSPVETLLNFCTGSVLIRAMTIPGCPLLDDTTHIILDEIHCRERYQDFLMNCLRDFALTKPYLKFIFVGEDPNIDFVSEYFGGIQKCPQLIVEGGLFPVKTVYLEEVLRYSWESISQNGATVQKTPHAMYTFGETVDAQQKYKNAEIFNVDELIEKVWMQDVKTGECLEDFLYMVRQDVIDVNYVHSNTSLSMLMAVAATGMLTYVELLLDAGADVTLKANNNNFTAREWANNLGKTDVVKALDLKARSWDEECHSDSKKCIVEDYFRKPAANKVDFGIILGLVHMIHLTDRSGGSILIFLPSYEDLNLLKERISSSFKNDPGWKVNPFVIHFLHAHVQTGDQRSMFEKAAYGLRKIILSTDVGQNCLTFEDVGFVIDCGKAKEDAHHVLAGTADANVDLFKGWISKTEANQRRERAGHCSAGVCFRLYSEKCFEEEMRDFVVPEILRISLPNLCLMSRALLRPEIRIAEFFECLPTPPHKMDILNAIETLKLMSVLDENEQLTILGVHLLDYSIDPRWAKALLYSVIFKCLDPVLTIASYVSYGNAFVYQYDPKRRLIAHSRKLALSDGTLSDHMAILKVFHKWESERALREGNIVEFCENYFVTSSTFDVLYGIRTRLLGQLRASGFVRNKGSLDVKDLNTNADNWAVVKAVLASALYPNLCTVNRINKNMLDRESDELKLHPSSVLAIQEMDWDKDLPSDWIMYNEKCYDLAGKVVLKSCTVVNAVTVALLVGNLGSKPTSTSLPMAPVVSGLGFNFTSFDRDNCSLEKTKARIVIDNWISVFSFSQNILDIVPLREHIHDMILRRLKRPELFLTEMDKRILDTVVDVLSREDFRIGLKQSSVGQWPKLVAGNLLSAPRAGFEMKNV